MTEQPSWELSPEGAAKREISTINSRIKELEMRLAGLEARIPNSNVISHKFWSRAFAILGHQLAITLVIYAIIFAVVIVFGILGAIGGGR